MGFRLLVPPSIEPVSVAEQKAFMRVELADEDALTASLLKAARQAVESITGRALITQKWQATFETSRRADVVELPVAPVQSVEVVTVDGVAISGYKADLLAEPAVIRLKPGWQSVEVTFTCGYGPTGADVPEPLRLAIKLMAAHWSENRLAVADASHANFEELPMGVRYLLATYRLWGRSL